MLQTSTRCITRSTGAFAAPACRGNVVTRAKSDAKGKSAQYNKIMQQQMGWGDLSPYEYYPERGLYYHEIDTNVICGSQPQNTKDIDYLHEHEGVATILSLQQDKDLQYWGVDGAALQSRCEQVGVNRIKRPIQDFDPHSLRKVLPSAVQALATNLAHADKKNGRVYVHCTAGLGRAPAVVIAYLYWCKPLTLDQAYKQLTDIRPCGPKREAIRGATYDILGDGRFDAFEQLPQDAYTVLDDEQRERIREKLLAGVPEYVAWKAKNGNRN